MKKLTEMAVRIHKARSYTRNEDLYHVEWQLVKIVKGEVIVVLDSGEFKEHELKKVQKIARATAVQLGIRCYTDNDWIE